jgi:hypothetical protein
VRNEVLQRVKEEKIILYAINGWKANWIGHKCVGTAFYKTLLKERYIEG